METDRLMRAMESMAQARADNPEWREGQAYFNGLAVVEPELAREITATDADPYYVEDNMSRFFERVAAELWPLDKP